jgi:hypothetical protein
MLDSEKRALYYDRVRPVIGDIFESKSFAAYRVSAYPKVVEALIRNGLLRAFIEDDAPITGGFWPRALGVSCLGKKPVAALDHFSRAHNTYEDRFELRPAPALSKLGALPTKPNVLIAYAPGCAAEVIQQAKLLHIPAILFSVLEGSRASQLVWVFDPSQSTDEDERFAEAFAQQAAATPGDFDRYEDFLEAGDLVLSMTKAVLLQGTTKERKDLKSLFAEGRRVIIRGSRSWPWETKFVSTAQAHKALASLSSGVVPRSVIPASLFYRQRVLVIGCGTASLALTELAFEVSELVLLDTKPFSLFNPIRQVCSTDDTEKLEKPFALQQIIKRWIDPAHDWEESREDGLQWLSGAGLSIGAAKLKLTEMNPDSVTLFESILDAVKPTLCIVGMGRSRDDNFTACEILRRKNIKHIVPTAFPGVTHFKHIVVDEQQSGVSVGPCYDCLQNHLPVDGGAGPTLNEEARSVYYGGTQPATLAETYPSAHSLYRIARALMLPPAARPSWWAPLQAEERTSLVGANLTEQNSSGWLYGTSLPGQMVAYGPADVVHARAGERCVCGRVVGKVGG